MSKKGVMRLIGIIITVIIIALFVYSLINFKFLRKEVTHSIEIWGLTAFFILSLILEGIPNIIGIEIPILTAIILEFDLSSIITLLFIAIVISNLVSFFIGVKLSKHVRRILKKERIDKYESLWTKYGKAAMIITAISPVPYIPAVAGMFKMDIKYFTFFVLGSRLLRHAVVFTALYLGYGLI